VEGLSDPSGRRPVSDFIDRISDSDAAAVVAAMKEVAIDGLSAARHLRGEIYEVRADGDRMAYRILFARRGSEGRFSWHSKGSPRRPRRRRPRVLPWPNDGSPIGAVEDLHIGVDISITI
jgi:hypothetical protein